MDWLTQRKEELFKDEGQDAERQIWETEPDCQHKWCKGNRRGNRRCTRAGAVKRDLDLVVGQSEMVTEKQPSTTRETRWDLREQLGVKKQKDGEIQESFCFTW